MSVVLWDVALTIDNKPIWIHNYVNEEVYCADCKHPMIAVKGKEKQHHFRHKVNSNCSSDSESALHYSKKFEIAEILKECGKVEVEGQIGKYWADVLFEDEWAIEVVFSNPPSEEKFKHLRQKLIIFNFGDDRVWNHEKQYEGITWDDNDFRTIVLEIGNQIINSEEVNVCFLCKEVKGYASRIKKGGRCVPCDYDKFIKWHQHKEMLDKRKNDFIPDYGRFRIRDSDINL